MEGACLSMLPAIVAEDQGELAIGIILSGTGTDGTLVCAPFLASAASRWYRTSYAKFDGMPTSAIQGDMPPCIARRKNAGDAATDVHTLVLHQETPAAPA